MHIDDYNLKGTDSNRKPGFNKICFKKNGSQSSLKSRPEVLRRNQMRDDQNCIIRINKRQQDKFSLYERDSSPGELSNLDSVLVDAAQIYHSQQQEPNNYTRRTQP